MADDRSILFTDLEYAAARRDPQFVPWVLEFLAQPDPPAGQPEDPPDDYQAQLLPPDAWSLDRLRQSLNPQALAGKTDDERQATRTGAWAALLAWRRQAFVPLAALVWFVNSLLCGWLLYLLRFFQLF